MSWIALSFTIDITKVTNFFFWQIFSMMIISNFRVFKLSDIDQGVQKHPIQKKWQFSARLKKKLSEKKIKTNFIVSRTTLCTQKKYILHAKIFFKKCLFAHDIRFAVEKKIGPNFENYLVCRHQKNASHTISIYGNCMITIFFQKTKTSVFLSPDFFIRIKQPQK